MEKVVRELSIGVEKYQIKLRIANQNVIFPTLNCLCFAIPKVSLRK
jgi:hypothetical protein